MQRIFWWLLSRFFSFPRDRRMSRMHSRQTLPRPVTEPCARTTPPPRKDGPARRVIVCPERTPMMFVLRVVWNCTWSKWFFSKCKKCDFQKIDFFRWNFGNLGTPQQAEVIRYRVHEPVAECNFGPSSLTRDLSIPKPWSATGSSHSGDEDETRSTLEILGKIMIFENQNCWFSKNIKKWNFVFAEGEGNINNFCLWIEG